MNLVYRILLILSPEQVKAIEQSVSTTPGEDEVEGYLTTDERVQAWAVGQLHKGLWQLQDQLSQPQVEDDKSADIPTSKERFEDVPF